MKLSNWKLKGLITLIVIWNFTGWYLIHSEAQKAIDDRNHFKVLFGVGSALASLVSLALVQREYL